MRYLHNLELCFGLQSWPKKCVLGCVISPLRQLAESCNLLGQTFLANSALSGISNDRGWVDLDLGSFPSWWADTVATYCPSRMVEHTKIQVNKTQSTRTWDALYCGKLRESQKSNKGLYRDWWSTLWTRFGLQGDPSCQRQKFVDFVASQTATTNVEHNRELCFGIHGDLSGQRLKKFVAI